MKSPVLFDVWLSKKIWYNNGSETFVGPSKPFESAEYGALVHIPCHDVHKQRFSVRFFIHIPICPTIKHVAARGKMVTYADKNVTNSTRIRPRLADFYSRAAGHHLINFLSPWKGVITGISIWDVNLFDHAPHINILMKFFDGTDNFEDRYIQNSFRILQAFSV